jgi:hypothetical protein
MPDMAVRLHHRPKLLAALGAVALLWCIVAGALAALQTAECWQAWDAQQRYRSVTGTVVASELRSSTGPEPATYRPRIAYRYEVDGQAHAGERYRFAASPSSDASASRALIDRHPPGSPITVWYDPRMPAEAVIDRGWPRDHWLGWLALQPVLVVGAGLLAAFGHLIGRAKAAHRCLAGSCGPGWEVPGWGAFAGYRRGIQVGHRPTVLATLAAGAAGYAATCLLATLVLASAGGDGDDPWSRRPLIIADALASACVIGTLAALVVHRRQQRFLMRIDHVAQWLLLDTPELRVHLRWEDIGGWQVCRQVSGGEAPEITYALYLGQVDRGWERVHAWGDPEVANHVAAQLARATGSAGPGEVPALDRPQPSSPSTQRTASSRATKARAGQR